MAVNLAQGLASASAAAQDSAALKRVFETVTADSCPRLYNFHMHTVCSDGKLQPEQLMEQAIAIGLQGFAITDHHSVKGYHRAQQWLNHYRTSHTGAELPHFWTGVEINADLLADEVHILAYAFDPDHASLQPYLQGGAVNGELGYASHVVSAIHTAGGFAVLAHPARYRRSAAELVAKAAEIGIDGVETYYAYNNPNPWHPSPRQTQEVQQLSVMYGLFSTCGTDTHGLSLLQRL